MNHYFSTYRFIFIALLLLHPSIIHGQVSDQTSPQRLGFDIKGKGNKVEFPFETYNNLIVIPLLLNGTLPLKFILDTGVRTAILMDKTITDILNLQYSRTITLIGAAGGAGVEAHVAPNVSFGLPGVKGSGQALLVMDKDYLELGSSLGTEVHGIIGYEIFSRFVVDINYVKNVITLYEPGTYKKRKSYQTIEIRVEDTKPYIYAYLKIKEDCIIKAKMLIDTGASHSLLLHMASHKDITLPEKTISTSLGRGLGGDIHGNVGRIPQLEFSEFKFKNIITSFPDKEAYVDIIASTERQGSIGGGVTNRFSLVFDYPNNSLYLKKNPEYKRKFQYNMSGIEVKAQGPHYKKFTVGDILKGSPADLAGIMVGDTIVMVNGFYNESLTLNYMNNLFRSKENKKIKLKILRNGVVFRKSFRLKEMI